MELSVKKGLFGYSTSVWNSRTTWAIIIGAVVSVANAIFPDLGLDQDKVTTATGFIAAYFFNSGRINDANREEGK